MMVEQPDLHHHMHTFIELVMVVEGCGTHIFNAERYPITVGDVFVIPPYTPHGYADTEGLIIYNILFKEKMLARYKAEVVNAFVHDHGVTTVADFGCGDGNVAA